MKGDEVCFEFHLGANSEFSLPEFLTLDLSSGFALEVFWWRRAEGELSNASNPEYEKRPG